jgi:hypothetical protein
MPKPISAWVAHELLDVHRRARQWIESSALNVLVEAMGGPVGGSIEEVEAWALSNLDTRGGLERRDAPRARLNPEIVEQLIRAAGPLGLLNARDPELRAYDCVVVLGGATTGNELRTAFVKDLIDRGLRTGVVCGLAAHRTFSPSERDEALAEVGIDTEWKHLLHCFNRAFGPLESEVSPAGGVVSASELDRCYRGEGNQALRFLVAPSPSDPSRANTSDSVAFFLERHSTNLPQNILFVTSAIYVPYQFFAVAARLVNRGICHVEFTGTPTSVSGDRGLLAQRVAQEIQSTVASVAELLRP